MSAITHLITLDLSESEMDAMDAALTVAFDSYDQEGELTVDIAHVLCGKWATAYESITGRKSQLNTPHAGD